MCATGTMMRYSIIYARSRARNADFMLRKPRSCNGLVHRGGVGRQAMSTLSNSKVAERNKERSLIMIKPNGVQRGLVGEVIKRFEQKGFKLVAMKFTQASEEHMKTHYKDLEKLKFYPGLCKYMSSNPVVPMVWEGLGVVKTGRVMLGETDPAKSLPGTIRGDFSVHIGRNLVHGSDSVESAKKEIALWFKDDEVVTYTAGNNEWIYE
ncbi:NME2 [Branchiostoma lanceolatum]|uniref:Nucleoside diphosphate kinase n=1 Tax=Branchiostoma lanceolatum TaxID=7740 RepID=A0A8K0A2L1_BRALA|nr:NME2 [Branchiostoma lanceolatum]